MNKLFGIGVAVIGVVVFGVTIYEAAFMKHIKDMEQ